MRKTETGDRKTENGYAGMQGRDLSLPKTDLRGVDENKK